MSIIVNQNFYKQDATSWLDSQVSGTFQGQLVSNVIMLLNESAPFGPEYQYTDLLPFEVSFPGYTRLAAMWSGPYYYFDGSWGAFASDASFVPDAPVTLTSEVAGYAVLGLPGETQVEFVEQFDSPAYIVSESSFLNLGLDIQIGADGITGAAEVAN